MGWIFQKNFEKFTNLCKIFKKLLNFGTLWQRWKNITPSIDTVAIRSFIFLTRKKFGKNAGWDNDIVYVNIWALL